MLTPHVKTTQRHVPDLISTRPDYGNGGWLVVLRSETGLVEIGPLGAAAAQIVKQAIIGDHINREWLDDYDRERLGALTDATRAAGMTA